MAEGYELWHIRCRGCKREVTREGGNELVGRQNSLVCKACGHRGADLIRVWHRGPKPRK
jgi:rRNA maturation endonuclease Nob1